MSDSCIVYTKYVCIYIQNSEHRYSKFQTYSVVTFIIDSCKYMIDERIGLNDMLTGCFCLKFFTLFNLGHPVKDKPDYI